MRDQFSGIAVFVRAAEAVSFAVAAEQMGLTRSAVGKTVARLEERLGVQLFHRTTRSLALTNEGTIFYERCLSALAEISAAEQGVDDRQHQPVGRIRISMPVLLGRHCIAPILLDLAREYVQLEIDATSTDRKVDILEEEMDLVIRTGELIDEADFKARHLGTQAMVLCAAPSYLQQHGTPLHLEDIGAHTALTYGKGNSVVPWRFNDQGRQVEIKARGRVRFDDLESIANAATGGNGLAWLPAWLIARQLRTGELVELLPQLRGAGYPINVVWPLGRYVPMRVRIVIDALVAKIPAMLT